MKYLQIFYLLWINLSELWARGRQFLSCQLFALFCGPDGASNLGVHLHIPVLDEVLDEEVGRRGAGVAHTGSHFAHVGRKTVFLNMLQDEAQSVSGDFW